MGHFQGRKSQSSKFVYLIKEKATQCQKNSDHYVLGQKHNDAQI